MKSQVQRLKSAQAKKAQILVLHGPNLNLLGEREPEIYGRMTLKELNLKLRQAAKQQGATLRIFQSNSESELIELLHRHRKWAQGVIFNPAAYTHYSIALRDAVAAVGCPTIEVHLSDLKQRAKQSADESFRRISVIAPVCVKQISGKGIGSYLEALVFFTQNLLQIDLKSDQ
ncbi:MAG: type II 3-dehydroquinate dehydratase [Bdellovibrionia bacterium]